MMKFKYNSTKKLVEIKLTICFHEGYKTKKKTKILESNAFLEIRQIADK